MHVSITMLLTDHISCKRQVKTTNQVFPAFHINFQHHKTSLEKVSHKTNLSGLEGTANYEQNGNTQEGVFLKCFLDLNNEYLEIPNY